MPLNNKVLTPFKTYLRRTKTRYHKVKNKTERILIFVDSTKKKEIKI